MRNVLFVVSILMVILFVAGCVPDYYYGNSGPSYGGSSSGLGYSPNSSGNYKCWGCAGSGYSTDALGVRRTCPSCGGRGYR